MKIHLEPLNRQVIVITGASSGIGLATARKAAAAGARLVLCARNQEALDRVCKELEAVATEVHGVVADVGSFEDVERLGREAMDRFGRIDTWVNNAGAALFGRLLAVPIADHRRLFETNFWGVVHGCQVAAAHMHARGGAVINVGSTLSDRAFPLQGMYSASKAAVQAYTNALRMELEHDDVPISITLIKPAAIATQYTEHARTYTGHEPVLPPPVYAPSLVADTILHCAEHPRRDVFVGGAAKAISLGNKLAPRLMDKLLERSAFRMQEGAPVDGERGDNLDEPSRDGKEEGGRPTRVLRRSAYTSIMTRPFLSALFVGSGFALTRLLR